VEKVAQKYWQILYVCNFQKMNEANNHLIAEKSPNLVTLFANYGEWS
jgi:hypothetical protein